jgi:hypothetical protein
MITDVLNKLQSYNFKVTDKGIISKYSQRTRRYEVAGQINDVGVYFHAQNVPPFKQGQNTFKDIFGENVNYNYTPIQRDAEIEHTFSFSDYINTTQSKNQFLIYLKDFHKKTLNKDLKTNLYDIRGVKSGNFADATLFPYINYDNEFLTAKIVKYNSNTGKRLKENYSNTWFHSEKTIKSKLGINGKISKNVNCFFGENLIADNDKPVVIVEAEKTAILLSYAFPQTVFIATGGIAKLKNLDYSFLADRQVFVFPDNGAKEWHEIAAARSWWVSDILENSGEPGEDIADYLTDHTDDKRGGVWFELYEQLWNINARELTTKNIKGLSINFEHKKELSFNYCLPIPKDTGLTYYFDNAKGQPFKGSNFLIYENEFQVLNANIDFNKTFKNEFGQWQQIGANEFIKRLEKCFRIVKHLNPDKDYRPLFSKVLYNIILNSNHTFNIGYIERVLIPLWDNDSNDVGKYLKYRNWRFASTDSMDRKDFQLKLNEDKKLHQTNQFLKRLQPLLDKKEYIKPEYIDLHDKRINTGVWNFIQEYNKNVLGCGTFGNYESKLKIDEYLTFCNKKIKRTRKLDSTYYNSNIGCPKNEYDFKLPSIKYIKQEAGVGQNIIKEYFNFKPNPEELLNIKEKIQYYISNPHNFTFERVNGRLTAIPDAEKFNARQEPTKEKLIDCAAAFDYNLNLKGSVLNIPEADAIQRDDQFLASWILFHNPGLNEEDRDFIKKCPMSFITKKDNFLQAAC